jgi:hypothetical protein
MSDNPPITQPNTEMAHREQNGRNGGALLDWAALLSRSIHPTRLWIIEAMRVVDRPLSASELEQVFDGKQSTSAISYHMTTLAKIGIVKLVDKEQVRGAWKRLYVFTSAVKPTASARPG